MTMVPSKFQQNIFDFVAGPNGNAIIEAVAGSGKTTTVLHALTFTQSHSAIFLAFNKAIASELASRVPGNTQAKTFHSLCFSPVTRAIGCSGVDTDKMRTLAKLLIPNFNESVRYSTFAQKLVGLAKQVGVGCLVDDTEAVWMDIVNFHNLELEHDDASYGVAVQYARDLLAMSNEAKTVDFDDLLYLAVKNGIKLPVYHWVFVDEAQDTNAIQRAILKKIMAPNARLVAVGDPAQAIYGFRGASSNSLELLAEEFNATTLPLSVSYRCSKAVVEYARQWVKHILPSDTAPDGEVKVVGKWNHKSFGTEDIVVCRTTAPLVQLAYKLITHQVPCRILGKEIGQGLVRLVNKMNATSIDDLELRLDEYLQRETQKLLVKDDQKKAEAITDKVEAVLCLIRSLPENERTVNHLTAVISKLFDGQAGVVTLCTIHKSKGLEANTIWWLNRSQCPSKWAKLPWQQQQELNLCYVATTRAKNSLYLIESDQQGE